MRKTIVKVEKAMSYLAKPDKWQFWLLTALLIKSILFFGKTYIDSDYPKPYYVDTRFAFSGEDSPSYFDPVENLLDQGSYKDDYRMPGYAWIYFLLRLVFAQNMALDVLVIIQLILSALSVYLLALIAQTVFKNNQAVFYITFFLYAFSTFTSLYDHVLLTESFCTSALIIAVYFLIPKKSKEPLKLFLSGLFLTWVFFLRPVMLPLFALFMLYILYDNNKQDTKTDKPAFLPSFSKGLVKKLFYFLLPLLIIDGVWMIRNYTYYQRIIPLTKTVYYPHIENSYLLPLFQFMNAYGGSIIWWEPGSDITFFKPLPKSVSRRTEVVPPDFIYTSQFNYDSLIVVRDMITLVENPETSEAEKKQMEAMCIQKLKHYTQSIKKEKPFVYHIRSRLRTLQSFFFHSGTYNLFTKASFELKPLELSLKIFYSLLYVFVVIFGFIGNLLLIGTGLRLRKMDFLLIAGLGLYVALIFPIGLKMDEFRYFVPGYPFFLLASIYTFVYFYGLFRREV